MLSAARRPHRPRRSRVLAVAAALASLVLVAAGCSVSEDEADAAAGPRVVASTAVIAEFAARVAGDEAVVVALIPAGADLHSYEPPPDVARRVARADLVLVNGCNLEEGLLDLIFANRRDDAVIVVVSVGGDRDFVSVEEAAYEQCDPHMWLDAGESMRYVRNIRGALAAIDPEHADAYSARADAYVEDLRALDEEVRAAIDAIAASDRRLVVLHDAFGFFARAYGLELAAALLPASPTQQPSAATLADVIELVRAEGVPAVYAEPQLNRQLIDAVATETGARVLPLYATFADGIESYEELMLANARSLVDGLGRGSLTAGESSP